jgi:hypothetical protein
MEYPNTGSLWPPKNRTNDKAPNVRGTLKLDVGLVKHLLETAEDCVEIELAGWTKQWQDTKYIALKASEPFKKTAKPDTSSQGAGDDSDIPF